MYLKRLIAAVLGAGLCAAGAVAVRAQSGPCSVGLPTSTATAPAGGGAVPISLVTQAGCSWSASTGSTASTSSTGPAAAAAATALAPLQGTGPGTVTLTLAPNPDPAPRTISVTVGGRLFVVTQLGTACSFTLTAAPSLASSRGGTGSFTVATQPFCAWSVSADASFVTFASGIGSADASGTATVAYTVAPNTGDTTTRRANVTVTNTRKAINYAFAVIAQGGESQTAPAPWEIGDLFAGIGSWAADGGTYRTMTPSGVTRVSNLNDAYGGTTTGCMIDPTAARGDLWTTSWDGLILSRFSDATHQLISTLDISAASLPSLPRAANLSPVPPTWNAVTVDTAQGPVTLTNPDLYFTEQLVFDKNGDFLVGTSMAAFPHRGLGHAYLLKFSKNEGAPIAGCGLPGRGPCLLDWWRVDAGGELPAGQNGAGANAAWTKTYKAAYAGAAGTEAARVGAAQAAVAALAPTVGYEPVPPAQEGTSGVDEVDLSSDGRTLFYTSEDGYIRRFDTGAGLQLPPILITSPDTHAPVGGKAYGFRILPDGAGHADGGAGFIVSMSQSIFRIGADGVVLKPSGANAVEYLVDPGVSHPFAMNLTPDAQSFWVATSQEDSSAPTTTGGKIYRFHIATGRRAGPFNVGAAGANVDVQGLCVKREYLASINQCFATDADGKGVLDSNGNPIAIVPCRRPAVCVSPGIDESGQPNAACYAPGEVPLALADRSSFEGDRSGTGGGTDLDLRPLTPGHRITRLTNLPPGLQAALDPASGDVIGVGGIVSYDTCPKALEPHDQPSDPDHVCASYPVGVLAADGASTRFTWDVHYRNAPPTIASQSVVVLAGAAVAVPTPASDADVDDALLVRARARVFDAARQSWVAGISLADYGLALTSNRLFPSAGPDLKVVGTPAGYPLAAPRYPALFEITLDVSDCNNAAVDGFTPATDLASACFHHASTVFTVTVVATPPNRPPVCSAAAPSQSVWPPNHKFADVAITGITDPDGDPVRITIASIWQDEPVTTQGSGRTLADAAGIGTPIASVRAERAGLKSTPGDGRVYQINFVADDGKAGGTCSGSVVVGVPHDQGNMSMPVDTGVRYDSVTGARIR